MVIDVTNIFAEEASAVIPPDALTGDREPTVYDFRRPTTLSREHNRVFDLAFETFARQWGTQLTARVKMLCQVTPLGVQMYTYDDYIDRLPATTAMMLCRVGEHSSRGVLQFPASGALNWVSHILGAQATTKVAERKFTRIEQTLVQNLVTETLEDLAYSLGGLLVDPIKVDSVQYNAQFAQAASKSALMLCAFFTVRVGEAEVNASLALPAEAVLPQLGEGSVAEPTELDAELLQHHLINVPMEVALSLNETQMTTDQILALSEGDTIKLDHLDGRPLHLTADGYQVATAVTGIRSGRIAAIIETTSESA